MTVSMDRNATVSHGRTFRSMDAKNDSVHPSGQRYEDPVTLAAENVERSQGEGLPHPDVEEVEPIVQPDRERGALRNLRRRSANDGSDRVRLPSRTAANPDPRNGGERRGGAGPAEHEGAVGPDPGSLGAATHRDRQDQEHEARSKVHCGRRGSNACSTFLGPRSSARRLGLSSSFEELISSWGERMRRRLCRSDQFVGAGLNADWVFRQGRANGPHAGEAAVARSAATAPGKALLQSRRSSGAEPPGLASQCARCRPRARS
jgi:hypothetical protein